MSRVPEGTDFETYLDDIKSFANTYFASNVTWRYTMTDGGQRYELDRMYLGRPNVYPEGKDSTLYGWYNPYLITKYNDRYHLRFKDTVMVDGRQMEQEFVYDPDMDKFVGMANAGNTIEAPVPAQFFCDNLTPENALSWQISKTDGSEDATKLLANAKDDFKNDDKSLSLMSFSVKNDSVALTVKYRENRKTRYEYFYYIYDVKRDGDNLTLQYLHGLNNADDKLTAYPSLNLLIQTLSQSYVVSAYQTRFVPTKIVFESTDSKYRFVLTLNN